MTKNTMTKSINRSQLKNSMTFLALLSMGSLMGCSFSSDYFLPSLNAGEPSSRNIVKPNQTNTSNRESTNSNRSNISVPVPQQLVMGSSEFKPNGVTPGTKTGTFVGKKAVELRGELKRLQESVTENNSKLQSIRGKTVSDSQRYHGAVSAINARLQVGTTPGNPVLVQQFNQALSDLKRIGDDIANMNLLTSSVTDDSTLAAFLAENTRAAFRLSGAVDQDHQQLAILEDEVNRTVVLIDRLLKELTEDIQRQTDYVSTERSNLNTLSAAVKSGELMGASLSNRALTAATSGNLDRQTSRNFSSSKPLVIVRFDRANVEFAQPLYKAVSKALEQRPNATFELVAVAPSSGGAARVALNSNKARRNAENVMRSLQRMGLPPQRISITARTSRSAQTNEVHLYLN
ncbi:MAG: hypothetical protein ACJZ9G_01305 [Rhodospirillales bacterium]|tara:strand:- start:2242 stop:3453 length:1212 start_codon:yes stop_codon:yes gene_type:complete